MDWKYKKHYDCWCREHIVYCDKPTDPKNQCLSIYMPADYMKEGGNLTTRGGAVYTAKTMPVVYLNIIGGYWSARLIGPLMMQGNYLKEGYVVVTVRARGRNTPGGRGKAPATLVNLKAGIRYLRCHRNELPGDYDKIITVGTSAGGAMSSLLGCTRDRADYLRS